MTQKADFKQKILQITVKMTITLKKPKRFLQFMVIETEQ